jgi:hypothetical protein
MNKTDYCSDSLRLWWHLRIGLTSAQFPKAADDYLDRGGSRGYKASLFYGADLYSVV